MRIIAVVETITVALLLTIVGLNYGLKLISQTSNLSVLLGIVIIVGVSSINTAAGIRIYHHFTKRINP